MTSTADGYTLDDIDRQLLSLLVLDGRRSNKELAEAAGVAPSTALTRVKRLRSVGAIRGIHADIDPAWFGSPLQAMVMIHIRAENRATMASFATAIAAEPQVLNVFFVSGAYDYMIHVAARDSNELRAFIVETVNAFPDVAASETYLIFDHLRGAHSLDATLPD